MLKENKIISYELNTNFQSQNYDDRKSAIQFLVIHYTELDLSASLDRLTDADSQVSAHYLVPPAPPYPSENKIIFSLVPEEKRAWHAGNSQWQNITSLNDHSIGIEIVNLGYTDKQRKRVWYPFSTYQIEAVSALSKDIIDRYAIQPTHILGHSDIAPHRKIDPGPLFPWEQLFRTHGIGAWYDEQDKATAKQLFSEKTNLDMIPRTQNMLKRFGYNVQETGILDQETKEVVRAFQMHFQPHQYSGMPDTETLATLQALIKKYDPKAF